MVKTLIRHEALGEDPDHIEPIVNRIIHDGVDVLYKKKSVSHIVNQILDNKKLKKEREVPLIEMSKKLQHFISAIRVVYAKEMRREVLGRFVPTLFGMINKELERYGYKISFHDDLTVINSRKKVRLISLRDRSKKRMK